jgi:C-terminal processing protease CtpA/Prc
MDEVLAHLPDATSLVIDIRNNTGGTTALAPDIAGRFTEAERTFGYVRLRNGPAHDDFTNYIKETVTPTGTRRFGGTVFVLTNRRDFSTAEDFVLAMRATPRATIVGDTTAGASGGPIVGELSNGWTYRLSAWIEYTPLYRTFEGAGLAPDVVVQPTAADAARGVDAALERALALARTG